MKNTFLNSIIITLLFGLGAQAEEVDMLLHYTLDETIEPVVVSEALTADSLVVGSGVTGTFPDYSSISMDGTSLFFLNAGFNSVSQSGAIDTHRYLGFSISPGIDFRLGLTGISLHTLRRTGGGEDHGLGAPSAYALWVGVSSRGFESVVASGSIPGNTSNEFHRIDIDLDQIDELQDVSGSVDFRLYLWAEDGLATPSQRQLRIDNIILSGTEAQHTVIPITDGEWQEHPNLGWVYVFAESPEWVYSDVLGSWFYMPLGDEDALPLNWFYAPY